MAYWFHRNPIKATVVVGFELKLIVLDREASAIISELRKSRGRLLDLLVNANNEASAVDTALTEYLSFLRGLIAAPEGGESSLRYGTRFKWTNSLLGSTPEVLQDSYFEAVSICHNYGLWLMKHAAMIAGKDDISVEESKQVLAYLKKAAGVFAQIEIMKNYLAVNSMPGSDLDPRVITAYLNQCTAEAQEVTIARAIEMKHNSNLIAGLALETYHMFSRAAESLKQIKLEGGAKWIKYLELKSYIYQAYAHCYYGDNLLSQDKCGEAIRCLQESKACYDKILANSKLYDQAKGPGTSAKITNHLFIRKLNSKVSVCLEKCQRENGFIYHQKVPSELPKLDTKATYGLANPEPFELPPLHPSWTPVVYAAFAPTYPPQQPAGASKTATKIEGDIPPVKEFPIHQTKKDPDNRSGCHIQ